MTRRHPGGIHERQGQWHEPDARPNVGGDRPQLGEVPRGTDEGDEVAALGELLGELEEGDDVAEGEPWEHHDVQRRRLLLVGFCLEW